MSPEDKQRLMSIPVKIGEFQSVGTRFSDLSEEFVKSIETRLSDKGFCLLRKGSKWDSAIPAGFFEVQHHDFSVNEHTDDVTPGHYFAILPYDIQKISTSRLARNPTLIYHPPGNSKKTDRHMWEEDMIIFNPRKPHGLHYAGVSVRLMIFTVQRIANDHHYRQTTD